MNHVEIQKIVNEIYNFTDSDIELQYLKNQFFKELEASCKIYKKFIIDSLDPCANFIEEAIENKKEICEFIQEHYLLVQKFQ